MAEHVPLNSASQLQLLTEELARERSRLLEAQAVARVGSWETDLLTLHVTWSPETFRIFGVDPQVFQPAHTSFLDHVHPEDRERVDAAFRHSFSTRDVCTVEHRLLAADGMERVVEERWRTFVDGDGKPVRAAGTCQDLTERRRLEAHHGRVQRMESLGTLAGGIAHDLNNVLTPILTAVDLLRGEASEEERARILDSVEDCAQRGAELVQKIQGFAHGRPGRDTHVDVVERVEDVARSLRQVLPPSIPLRVVHPDGPAWLEGDPAQLHQVLMNLCTNARDAMPNGGALTLTVAVEQVDAAECTRHGVKHHGAFVHVTVADTGVGIPAALHERVFEPFYTTKAVGHGSGLGLATVHNIVRGHGGFVTVDSRPGHGARFHVYLPALAPEAVPAAVAAPTKAAPHPRGKGELVLVVDDEPAIRDVVRRALERNGYRVVTATDGAEGVAVFSQRRAEIDAVLTDMSMPHLDGAGLVRAVRGLEPRVPILGSSGLGHAPSAGSEPLAITAWMPKPYTVAVLLRTLREALDARPAA